MRGRSSLTSRSLAVFLGLAFVLTGLGTVRALDSQTAQPGSAPAPRSGPFRPDGFVRVIDGSTLEVSIDGKRVGVGVLGIDPPPYGTSCGDAAKAQLQAYVGRGVTLRDDPANVLDARKRRMYQVNLADGRSAALTLVSAGLARANGRGPEAAALAAAESKARAEKTGCLWGGTTPALAAPSGGSRMFAPAAVAATNFGEEIVASGLSFPTSFAFLPDGRLLVTEKDGRVRIAANGVVDPTPVLDIRQYVNSYWDRGLLGVAVDPAFATNRRFYLFYVYENDAANREGSKTSQVARFTLSAGNTAEWASRTVILGTVNGAGCPAPSTLADCLPAESPSHAGGAMHFAPDGAFFISVGDAASFTVVDPLAYRSQQLDSLAGKILRVDTDGKGLSTNPFWNANPNHPRSKAWALGFRNPFRTALKPGTPTTLYIGDVGWSSWEEQNVVQAGTNAGWPCYEGNHVQVGYQPDPICTSLYNAGTARGPLIEWDHDDGDTASVGGTFYTGTEFPAEYQGAYFYADYTRGWIKRARVNAANQLVDAPIDFATNLAGPVQLESGPDGAIYYVTIGSGEIRRIRYFANYTPLDCPTGQYRAEYFNNKTLAGVPTVQRCESSINYDWGLTGPDGLPVDGFSARWTGRFMFGTDNYQFRVTSDDGARLYIDDQPVIDDWKDSGPILETATRSMTAGEHTVRAEYYEDTHGAAMQVSWVADHPSQPPVPTIATPAEGATFKVGDVIQLAGSATDPEDGVLPGTSLRWDVILKHCPGFGPSCHDHPLITITGATGQFTAPDHGDGSRFEIRLTATDSVGLTSTVVRRVDPITLDLTLTSNPVGATVFVDGTAHYTPHTVLSLAGSTHTISVQPGPGQQFVSWAHGGAQQQDVTLGATDVTFTANLSGPAQCPAGQWLAQYFPNLTLTAPMVAQQCETAPVTGPLKLAHNWGAAVPIAGMPADRFSGRWTGRFTFPAGAHEFRLTSDDGARLYVDDVLVVDDWVDSSVNTVVGTRTLTAGEHVLRVEFYDNALDAVLELGWTQTSAPPTATLTPTATSTATPTSSTVPAATSTHTPTPTRTPVAGSTGTSTPTPTQTASPTPTATVTPTVLVAQSACSPRPRVVLDVAPAGPGQRTVTISTTSHAGFGANALRSIRFDQLTLASVQAAGQPPSAVPFTVTPPAGTTQASFTIRRTGPGALMARIIVTDNCGTWPTFVGAGPTAGW